MDLLLVPSNNGLLPLLFTQPLDKNRCCHLKCIMLWQDASCHTLTHRERDPMQDNRLCVATKGRDIYLLTIFTTITFFIVAQMQHRVTPVSTFGSINSNLAFLSRLPLLTLNTCGFLCMLDPFWTSVPSASKPYTSQILNCLSLIDFYPPFFPSKTFYSITLKASCNIIYSAIQSLLHCGVSFYLEIFSRPFRGWNISTTKATFWALIRQFETKHVM